MSLLLYGKRPAFRRKRDLCETLLTAMVQTLPFLISSDHFDAAGMIWTDILDSVGKRQKESFH